MTEELNKKIEDSTFAKSLTLQEDFEYRHKNPYHEKLEAYSKFVFRDEEAEKIEGTWNTDVFKNDNELVVEIGSGYGHFMRDYCQQNPKHNFVGMDYRFKRSFELVKKLNRLDINNFRYLRARGERINFMFSPGEVDKIFFFFSDPWRKKRHHKKRLFQKPFLDACYTVLKTGGELLVKTDHDGYADWMDEVLKSEGRFEIAMHTKNLHKNYAGHFLAKYITKFEKIFLSQEIPIKAFVLKKK